jgi:isopenicillin N synthase-like dioxygenase
MQRHRDVIGALLRTGQARVRLTEAELDSLEEVRRHAAAFFARDEHSKRRFGDADGLFGFRPYGMQFSDDPALKDECESFAYWADRSDLIPDSEHIGELTPALSVYWKVAGDITAGILEQLASHYRYPDVLDFGPASYLEINSYGRPPERDLLQTRHEDGHLFTLVAVDQAGLEIEVDGAMSAAGLATDEMIVMPGSLLTAMTGGEISPLYHQVRNFGYAGRLTVLYFVNTPMKPGTVAPYLRNQSNRDIDIAELSRRKCTLFGKPLPKILI